MPAPNDAFRTVETEVADRVRRAILLGEFPPGTRMVQSELAERMGTSITPIRVALKKLEAERLVEIEPRRYVVVHKPSAEELKEIFEIRLLLEPATIKRAARYATPEAIADAGAILDKMESETDLGEWCWLNREFHLLLARCCGGLHLARILVDLLSLSAVQIRTSPEWSSERLFLANVEHREILQAFTNRDPEAARIAALRHLQSSRRPGSQAAQST